MASKGDQTNTTNASEEPVTELSAAVEELLNKLSNQFAGVSSEIFARMDEMSRRLDNLEATVVSRAAGSSNKGDRTS